jgi:hypothetical protein
MFFPHLMDTGDYTQAEERKEWRPAVAALAGRESLMMVRIYIHLLNEGTIVARPADGERIKENVFRVLPAPDSETESGNFRPGARSDVPKKSGTANSA